VLASPSERIRVEKLRRCNAFVISLSKTAQEGFRAKKSLRREKRNRWSRFVEEIDEIPSAVRSREVAQGLSLKEHRKNRRRYQDIGVIGSS
jgi:hypothetical protein